MPELSIRPAHTIEEIRACARLMSGSEPWVTLGRNYEASLRILLDERRERYVGYLDAQLAGFIILRLDGPFVGYVQTVCIAAELRGQGIGTALVAFAEQRIFGEHANVFMCVSSFNLDAKRLYERMGYATVGVLENYLVPGHAEILLRKTRGPISSYSPAGVSVA